MDWPSDADGDVLRRLRDNGFDFEKKWGIDFEVDFAVWPPPRAAIEVLRRHFPAVTEVSEVDQSGGYVLIEVVSKVSYEFVVGTQQHITGLVSSFGGQCDAWGVFH